MSDLSNLDRLDGLGELTPELEAKLTWLEGRVVRENLTAGQRLKIVAGRAVTGGCFLVMALAMFMFAEVHQVLLTGLFLGGAGVVLGRPVQ